MRDKITVEEWINQFNKVVDLFVAADKEYKKWKQVNEGDDEWLKNFDYWVCSFKYRVCNWQREAGREVHEDGKGWSKGKSSKSFPLKTNLLFRKFQKFQG